MKISKLRDNWNQFGAEDPLWAILTESSKMNNNWDEKEFFARGEHEINALMRQIDNLKIPLHKGAALDFGCGVGRLTQPLAKRFETAAGVDIAQTMIDQANTYNKYGDNCKYYINTVDNLEIFPDASFDLVYSLITLQHMKPIYAKKYIEEFIRILKPEGLIVFQVPDAPPPMLGFLIHYAAPLLNMYRRMKYSKSNVMEVYGIAQEDIKALAEKNGARITHTKTFQDVRENWKDYLYFIKKA